MPLDFRTLYEDARHRVLERRLNSNYSDSQSEDLNSCKNNPATENDNKNANEYINESTEQENIANNLCNNESVTHKNSSHDLKKQSIKTYTGRIYTTEEILNKFIVKRKFDKYQQRENVIVSWDLLFKFINNTLHFQTSKDVMKSFIPDYGKNDYCELWHTSSGLDKLLTSYVLKADIISCANVPINEEKIKSEDIDWDELIDLLKTRYGIDMLDWQLFSLHTEKTVTIIKIIDRIRDYIRYKPNYLIPIIPNS